MSRVIRIKDDGGWKEVDFFLRLHGHLPDLNCGGPAMGSCKYTPDGRAINEFNDFVEELRRDPEYVKREKAVQDAQTRWLKENSYENRAPLNGRNP